jgi:hypothetical protein
MTRKFERVSEYNDLLCYVILKAPDRFPADAGKTLDSVFSDLRANLPTLKKRIKDETKISILNEMLTISYEAYIQGNSKKAIYALQELQGIVWPKFKMESKYEQEAKIRLGISA